jgi:hypothetical protein
VSWEAVEAELRTLDAEDTALYWAAADVGLVGDGSRVASAIVAVRGLVVGKKERGLGLPWSCLDPVLAEALRLAVKRRVDSAGLRLFEVGTLVDALLNSKAPPSFLFTFLDLLAANNAKACDARVKLAAVGLDAGKDTYPAATRGQVKPALKAARKAASKADKKRKAKAEPSPKRTRSGPRTRTGK